MNKIKRFIKDEFKRLNGKTEKLSIRFQLQELLKRSNNLYYENIYLRSTKDIELDKRFQKLGASIEKIEDEIVIISRNEYRERKTINNFSLVGFPQDITFIITETYGDDYLSQSFNLQDLKEIQKHLNSKIKYLEMNIKGKKTEEEENIKFEYNRSK